MATAYDVYQTLQSLLSQQLFGVVPTGNVVIGFPSTSVVQAIGNPSVEAQTSTEPYDLSLPVVFLFDRGRARDVTRWIPKQVIAPLVTAAQVAATPTAGALPVGNTATITITGAAAANDAISLSLSDDDGVVYVSSSAQTATTVATSFAALITDTFPNLSASASGTAMKIINTGSAPLSYQINTANTGLTYTEYHRAVRAAQIIILGNRFQAIQPVAAVISNYLGQLEASFGYQVPEGSFVRVIFSGDELMWDNVGANLARQDLLVSLEYGTVVTQAAYPVLVTLDTIGTA